MKKNSSPGHKKKMTKKDVWSSFKRLFETHPRPWCSGVDTTIMRGGIIDSQGKLVYEIASINVASMLAHAVNELSDDSIRVVDNI